MRNIHAVGKLVVEYQAFGRPHSMSVGLLLGVSPTDSAVMSQAANDLMGVVKNLVPPAVVFTGWHTKLPDGSTGIAGGFSPPQAGTHGTFGPPWRSATLTFSGRGTGAVAPVHNGVTRMVVHVYNSFGIVDAEKQMSLDADIVLGQIASALNASTVFWSDYFGHKAQVRGYVTQQFNAHTQKVEGA